MEYNAAVGNRELEVHPYMGRSQKHTVRLTNKQTKRGNKQKIYSPIPFM